MFSNSHVEYHFNHPCRCICSSSSTGINNLSNSDVNNSNSSNTFFVGSCWLPNRSDSNSIYEMKYNDDLGELMLDASFTHSSLGEIYQLSVLSPNHYADSSSKMILTTHRRRSTSSYYTSTLLLDTVLWKMPSNTTTTNSTTNSEDARDSLTTEQYDEDDIAIETQVLEELVNFSTIQSDKTVSAAYWNTHQDSQVLTTCTDKQQQQQQTTHTSTTNGEMMVQLWDVTNVHQPIWTTGRMPSSNNTPTIVCDPHDPNRIAIATGCDVIWMDLRCAPTSSNTTTMTLKGCHRYGITDLDANPNRPFVYVTAGQDSLVKFYDIRQLLTKSTSSRDSSSTTTATSCTSALLKIIKGGHTHWVSSVRYNPYHDQLLVTSGTDSLVNLWRMSSISSAPILEMGEEDEELIMPTTSFGTTNDENDYYHHYNNNRSSHQQQVEMPVDTTAPDINVQKYEHQESVYGTTWIDPWCYVSLSYDGHVVLHHVPSKEKYKILL